MKKICCFIVILSLVVCLAACSGSSENMLTISEYIASDMF